MNVNPEGVCRDIDAELVRNGAADLTPVRMVATHEATTSVARPRLILQAAGRLHPAMLDVEVDRERLPPGIVEAFARRLLADPCEQSEFDAETNALVDLLRPLAAILPTPPVVAQDVGSSFGRGRHSVLVKTLDARLERTPQLILRMSSRDATTVASTTERETRLAAMIAAAGSRAAALTCCPIAATAVLEDPHAWRERVEQAINGATIGIAFRDGSYQPSIRLGDGVRWKGASLDLARDLPRQIRLAAVGRPLKDLVGHHYIPDNIVVTDIHRRADGETTVRTDASPIPLAPLLAKLEIRLDQ